MRVLVGSLVGNAVYTRLGYRRAFPPALPALEEAIGSARLDGHFTGESPAAANIAAMVEQVAMMMMLDRAFHPPAVPLRGRRRCIAVRCDSLLRSGHRFRAGIGRARIGRQGNAHDAVAAYCAHQQAIMGFDAFMRIVIAI